MTITASVQVTAFAFTGYPVTDLGRARAFYEGLLGLTPATIWEGEGKGWIEYVLGDSTLAITNSSEKWKPASAGPAIALEVADFSATMATLRAVQVIFFAEPVEFPPCNLAVISDPDGNQLVIHRRKAAV